MKKMPQWTKEQQQAIDSRNGTILVSAAAGSGKTTVLVERVIRRLEDKENPCSADRLLIVTFTKAATAQMREKIAAAIEKRLELEPDNEHLLRQRMLLPFAHISTIDSFCGELVRENFQQLGISPDFKLLEQTQLDLMQSDAADAVIEKAYNENSEAFRRLLDLFVTSGDDSKLSAIITSLYENSRAFPFSEKWLDSLVAPYENPTEILNSPWGATVIDYVRDMVDYCRVISKSAIDAIEADDPEAYVKFAPLFGEYEEYFDGFISVIDNGTWEEICEYAQKFRSGVIARKETTYGPRAKAIKAEVVEIMTKRLPKLLCCTDAEFKEDVEFLLSVVQKLVDLVKAFAKEFSALKAAANGVDFSDVVDYTVKLLVEDVDENGNPVKTALARAVSQKFDEILIDEFQDINETQNILFKAVSNDESNLFMVGDVKQSIYRFRQAMPSIFLNRRKALAAYVDGNYPARINLDFNFRSRKGVTDYVNFTFSQLMSEKAGELDYDENEALKAKASYEPRSTPDAEIHIISDSTSKVDRTFEAEYIADYIQSAIDSGLTVKDGDAQRKAEYKDFCILLRSTKNKAEIYSSVLNEKGIPCHISSRNGFFDATEIKTVLAFMRAVDNPQQDIPLVTTMLSPAFGFTPDDLAAYRIENRKASYYSCVVAAAEQGSRKCRDFISCLRTLRTLSATLGAGDFVRELLDVTGYDALVCAMPNGSQRRANLALLLDYAQKYEQAGHIGISGFIRFIDRVEKQRGDMEIANEISESANVVRIMSIHKSKGLEFPVCILADCSARFNDDYLKNNVSFHPVDGIAFRRIDSYRRFDTLPQKAVQLAQERSERSEELRVLYVALTRAKEQLVCILREDNPDKKILGISSSLTGDKKLHPYKVLSCKSIADWLLLSSVRHPDFMLPMGANPYGNLESESALGVIKYCDILHSETVENEDVEASVDEELLELLKNRLSYTYPYGDLSDIVAKISPSQLEKTADNMEYFATMKPDFILKDGMTSASKGTAVHKFMEFYDYSLDVGVKEQARLMVESNRLSDAEEQVLDFDSLSRFFQSELAKEIAASDTLLREKKVTFTVPAKEIYPDISDLSADEPIVVQGYIDCAFLRDGKWVIVDYKTDKVKNIENLGKRYHNQLKMYERALAECTGIPVDCTLIYSLHLGEILHLD